MKPILVHVLLPSINDNFGRVLTIEAFSYVDAMEIVKGMYPDELLFEWWFDREDCFDEIWMDFRWREEK